MSSTKTKRAKVAVVVSTFPELTETFILHQITGLLDSGYDIDIVANKPPRITQQHQIIEKYGLLQKTHYRLFDVPGIKWVCRLKAFFFLVGMFLFRPCSTFCFFKSIVHRPGGFCYSLFFLGLRILYKKYDIIHCHFGQNALPFVELLKLGLSFRLLTSFHGHDAHSYVLSAGESVYHELFQRGQHFTANTQFTKEKLIRLGCPEGRILILPESFICKDFIKKHTALPRQDAVILLSVGRLVEKKGYEYSLRAVARTYQHYKNIQYWIVGDGPLFSELRALTSQLQLEHVVIFQGPKVQEEIVGLYHAADIFMLPSVTASNGDMEGQALVLQEAQAAELPVLSTRHNGIPDGVLEGKSGFLVPERDDAALAEKIIYLIEHPDERRKMGLCGKDYVIHKYDTRIVTQQLIRLYEQLVTNTKADCNEGKVS